MEEVTVPIKYGNGLVYEASMIKVTIEEVFNALKENGFEHIRDEWFSSESGKITAACVLGQAFLNLQVIGFSFEMEEGHPLSEIVKKIIPYKEVGDIEDNYNDQKQLYNKLGKYTLQDQLDRYSVRSNSKWFTGAPLGSTIVEWNDRSCYDFKDHKTIYELATYEEVVQMAYDVMKPHFKRTITLLRYNYETIKEPVLA